jgi:hypothetical protein
MLRRIGAVAAGVVAAFVLIAISDLICARVYPLPPGLDAHDRKVWSEAMKSFPPGEFLLLLGGWFVGTLAGTWIAAKIARSRVSGAIVGVVLLAGTIANMVMIPHPAWFMATSFAALFVAAALGTWLGAPPRATAAA